MVLKFSNEEFISKVEKIHNNKYIYDKTNYTGMSNFITVKCTIHGYFEIRALKHLHGKQGCAKCSNKGHLTLSYFKNYCKNKFNNKFDYSLVKDVSKLSGIITIICPIHNKVEQTVVSHIRSVDGCKLCNHKNTSTESFIDKVRLIHKNKYSYSKSNYITAKTKIIITCPTHGDFFQTPDNHLQGKGCKLCMNKIVSKLETRWLNYIEKKNNLTLKRQVTLENTNFKVDGFDPSSNTVYEFHGDYFHGNPLFFKSTDLNEKNKIPFGDLYNKTIERENIIKDLGYNLIVIWEHEWVKLEKELYNTNSYRKRYNYLLESQNM